LRVRSAQLLEPVSLRMRRPLAAVRQGAFS
jgi:hypothetical protein